MACMLNLLLMVCIDDASAKDGVRIFLSNRIYRFHRANGWFYTLTYKENGIGPATERICNTRIPGTIASISNDDCQINGIGNVGSCCQLCFVKSQTINETKLIFLSKQDYFLF